MYEVAMTLCKRLALLAALLSPLWTSSVGALPTDREQPIEITADHAVQEGGQVTYTGDVVIIQGSLRIEANQVVVYSEDRKVQRMIATGDRAHLQQLPEAEGALVKARARTITYLQREDLIILEEDAEVEQEGSVITGKRIDYLVATETVRAQSGTDGSDRVQMVLQPETRPDASEPSNERDRP